MKRYLENSDLLDFKQLVSRFQGREMSADKSLFGDPIVDHFGLAERGTVMKVSSSQIRICYTRLVTLIFDLFYFQPVREFELLRA